ncbi:hypothetical protein RhiJN_27619 [Ceratobasidium sp. AG-Ba]|nr:hypothetical protein RhiJN_13569 [Ceratobasidium sp. AG-Ba]QRV99600.1 hypothetical protein RhiJN_27619 [Ceratobasidium sp. AG-Ba]QRW14131.1 hypothetical protein RhiLY_13130 [Ceratobasidium sp. AG-Ba]
MNNWLCNFSGFAGCWFPMDLMQEHNIRELKNKSQRRDEDFEGSFFQKVVSRNTRWLTQIRLTINREVKLEDRSTLHGRAKRSSTLNRLRTMLSTEEVHAFSPGRSFGWLAQDDLTVGRGLMPAKVSLFLRRMLATDPDVPILHVPDNEAESDKLDADENHEIEEPFDAPLPPMVMDGQLVLGEDLDEPTLDELFARALDDPTTD